MDKFSWELIHCYVTHITQQHHVQSVSKWKIKWHKPWTVALSVIQFNRVMSPSDTGPGVTPGACIEIFLELE